MEAAKQATEICEECHSRNSFRLNYSRGERFCKDCGYVIESNIIDEAPEWRNFSAEASGHGNESSRVGGPLSDEQDMDTRIVGGNVQLNKKLEAGQKRQQDPQEKSIANGIRRIRDLCQELKVKADVQKISETIFKDVEKAKKLKGRNLSSVVAAILYLTCKSKKPPIKKEAIIAAVKTPKKEVLKCINLVRKYAPRFQGCPEEAVKLACGQLQLKKEYQDKAVAIVKRMTEKGLLGGTNPYTRVGVILILLKNLHKLPIEISDIARCCNISESTLKTQYKKMELFKNDIYPDYVPSIFQGAVEGQKQEDEEDENDKKLDGHK